VVPKRFQDLFSEACLDVLLSDTSYSCQLPVNSKQLSVVAVGGGWWAVAGCRIHAVAADSCSGQLGRVLQWQGTVLIDKKPRLMTGTVSADKRRMNSPLEGSGGAERCRGVFDEFEQAIFMSN